MGEVALKAKYPNGYIAEKNLYVIQKMFPDLSAKLEDKEFIVIKGNSMDYLIEVFEKARKETAIFH